MPQQSRRLAALRRRLSTLLLTLDHAIDSTDILREHARSQRQRWGRANELRRQLAGWRRSLKYRLDHWEPMESDAQTLLPPEERDGT